MQPGPHESVCRLVQLIDKQSMAAQSPVNQVVVFKTQKNSRVVNIPLFGDTRSERSDNTH